MRVILLSYRLLFEVCYFASTVAVFTNILLSSPICLRIRMENIDFPTQRKIIEKLPVSTLTQLPTSSLCLNYNRTLSWEFYSNGRSSREPQASKHSAGVIELVQLHPEGSIRWKIGNSRDTADEDHIFPYLAHVFPRNMDRKISRHLVIKVDSRCASFHLAWKFIFFAPQSLMINHSLRVYNEFSLEINVRKC